MGILLSELEALRAGSRASSGVGPCDVPFRYASGPIPRYRGMVARWHAHPRGLAIPIRETSGLDIKLVFLKEYKIVDPVKSSRC